MAQTSADRETEDVARALLLCVGLLRRRLRQVPVAGELTFPETAALGRLDRGGPAAAADLARQEQISPQSMGATLGELEARGLVRASTRSRRWQANPVVHQRYRQA